MYKTFELDADRDSQLESSKKYKNTIGQRTENNFFNATVKKNFFNNQQDDQYQYISGTAPSDKSSKRAQSDANGQKKNPSKNKQKDEAILQPFKPSKHTEVYQNVHQNSSNVDEFKEFTEPSYSQNQSNVESSEKRRNPRRRAKRNNQQEQNERSVQQKIPSKVTDIFFEDSFQQNLQKQQKEQQVVQRQQRNKKEQTDTVQETEELSLPKPQIRNQFLDSDEQVEVKQQQENIITGSQYFNYNSEPALARQIFLDVREKTTLRMQILRDKDGFNTFWPQFHLYFFEDTRHLLSAKKTSSRPTSTFIISRSKTNFEEDSPYYLGKMKSNVLGDVINIFGTGLSPSNAKERGIAPRQLLATVVFQTSLFQMGKPREFLVYIKKPQYKYYSDFSQVKLYDEEIPLNILYEKEENKEKIRQLKNRAPVWVKEISGYMLNFKGRVQKPSIKNFILEETSKDIVIFGKVNQNKFNFDISSGISTYIAFAVALSSFDSRLVCQ